MRYQKLFSDDAGESHWEDVEVTVETRVFAPPAENIEISEGEPVRQMMFLRLQSGWNEPTHPTPVRQKLICLAGAVRVPASDGQFRDIGRGDVWHMEDNHGKGHHTMVTSDEDFECVIVQYE
jgi:hypothetical protein